MNLAKKLLNNRGLIALTVEAEQDEIKAVTPKRRIKFAFFQKDLQGGKIPYWHTEYRSPTEFGSTLSLLGLKQWGFLK